MPEDRIQREIEEILNRLDQFVPERKTAPRRGPTEALGSFLGGALDALARISLRHVMLTAVALIVISLLARMTVPALGTWLLVAGVILFLTAFALSFVSRSAPPTTEKRWRGRPIDLNEPTFSDRIRAWLQAKRRPRP